MTPQNLVGQAVRMRRKKESERGAVLIFVAISLVVLVAFMALAIDVGYMYTAKAQLQASVDAAALAGASALGDGPEAARARAVEYAAKNSVYGDAVPLTDADIELGMWNKDTRVFTKLPSEDEDMADAVRVTGNLTENRGNPLALVFARVFGNDEADVRAQSTARGLSGTPWDIVIIQDITASFNEEIDRALDADRGLVGCIADNTDGDSRVGFGVHTGWGKALSPLRTIDAGYADLAIIINGVKPCGSKGMPVCSGTDQAAGMETGLNIFATSSPNPAPNAKKGIVLVSDGRPNADKSGSHPKLTDQGIANLALDFADEAWENDIHVFTVFYDEDNDDYAAGFLEDMTRGVGTFHRTPDPDELGMLLSEVCSAIGSGVRLVE